MKIITHYLQEIEARGSKAEFRAELLELTKAAPESLKPKIEYISLCFNLIFEGAYTEKEYFFLCLNHKAEILENIEALNKIKVSNAKKASICEFLIMLFNNTLYKVSGVRRLVLAS